MANKVPLNAQIESEVVDFVKVLRAGDRRYSANRGINGAATPVPSLEVVKEEVDSPMRNDQIRKMMPSRTENNRRVVGYSESWDKRTKTDIKMKVQARCWVIGRV